MAERQQPLHTMVVLVNCRARPTLPYFISLSWFLLVEFARRSPIMCRVAMISIIIFISFSMMLAVFAFASPLALAIHGSFEGGVACWENVYLYS